MKNFYLLFSAFVCYMALGILKPLGVAGQSNLHGWTPSRNPLNHRLIRPGNGPNTHPGSLSIQDVDFEDISALLSAIPPLQSPAIAWGDYDNDGYLDLLITGNANVPVSRLLHFTEEEGYVDRSSLLPGLPQVSSSSAAWADYDNDGRLDLMLTGVTQINGVTGYASRLYHNTGAAFEDKTSLIPSQPQVGNGSVVWADYDNDGRVDLFITGITSSGLIARLYHNTGTGFEDKSNLIPALPGMQLSAAAFGDYDNDGKPDLVLTGVTEDIDNPFFSKLYHNTGDGFADASSVLPNLVGMASGVALWNDYDNDGRLDLLLTGSNGDSYNYPIRLYHNTANGFQDVSNFTPTYFSAASFGDFDNDGLSDLILTGATTNGNSSKLYHNTGNGFTDVSSIIPGGLPQISNGAVSWVDYINGGNLGLLITGNTDTGNVLKFYYNNSSDTNTPPSSPTALTSNPSSNSVQLSWTASTDPQTPSAGLNYNIYVSDTVNSVNIVSPLSDQHTGFRRVVQVGNSQMLHYTLTGLQPNKKYYWSVQAIDRAYAGSPFAQEQQFTTNIGQTPLPDTATLIGNITVTNEGKRNRIAWNTLREEAGGWFKVEKLAFNRQFISISDKIYTKGTPSFYFLYDPLATPGKNSYRIKTYRTDGNFIISDTVSVYVSPDNGCCSLVAYPNPVHKFLTVVFNCNESKYKWKEHTGLVSVVNSIGNIVMQTRVKEDQVVLDFSRFAKGLYFIKYTDGYNTGSVKVVKQ